jgi:hypothetical protein
VLIFHSLQLENYWSEPIRATQHGGPFLFYPGMVAAKHENVESLLQIGISPTAEIIRTAETL